MIRVSELRREDEEAWSDLVAEDERALIYSTPQYRSFLQSAVGGEPKYLGAWSGDELLGMLPLFFRENQQFGKVINSLPWYGSHGGCVVGGKSPQRARAALLTEFSSLTRAEDVLSATLILSPFEERFLDLYRKILLPTTEDGRIGQITELPADGPESDRRLEKVLRQKTRNLARKSRKQGFLLVRSDDDWAWRFLFDTHLENMQAIGGHPKPWSHFQAIRTALPERWRSLSVAIFGDEPVAALLLLYFNRTVEYFTPVIQHDYRSMQPLSFLIWSQMMDAIQNGYRWWNWGGTWKSQTSLHHFKAGWGGADHHYSYVVTAPADTLNRLQTERDDMAAAFPFYYLYPFSALD